jgi:hypothetical protein
LDDPQCADALKMHDFYFLLNFEEKFDGHLCRLSHGHIIPLTPENIPTRQETIINDYFIKIIV